MHKMPPFGWLDFINCEKQNKKKKHSWSIRGPKRSLKSELENLHLNLKCKSNCLSVWFRGARVCVYVSVYWKSAIASGMHYK